MKILTAQQLQEADAFTQLNEPITPINLMERAANALCHELALKYPASYSYIIFCGPGNNGGDGLAMARMLSEQRKKVIVYILKGKYSKSFITNFERLKSNPVHYSEIDTEAAIENIKLLSEDIVLDALFGIGLNRPLEGLSAKLIQKMNEQPGVKIAIDIPSGLSADLLFTSTPENTFIAHHTLSIQLPKLAFLFAENACFTGTFSCEDIGLHPDFLSNCTSDYEFVTAQEIRVLMHPRARFGHKGTFGHALLIAGSEDAFGAALLASRATIKSGCGKVTAMVPEDAIAPLMIDTPEVMTQSNRQKEKQKSSYYHEFDAIGFGPGIGFESDSQDILAQLLEEQQLPIVLDADALTLLSKTQRLYLSLSPNTLLTPHPAEFDRLTQVHKTCFDRFKSQLAFSKKYQVTVLLKGHHTCVTTPDGKAFFNSTGNDGMATAGSGDVLTGIITSLCAQGYEPTVAAIVGAYIHGYAGDAAAQRVSRTSMLASDIISHLSNFFLEFER